MFDTHAMNDRTDTSAVPQHDAAAVIASLQKKIALLELDNREFALREHRFALMLEHAADFIVILNRDIVIEYCSPSWERVMDYPVSELIGKHARDFIHPDDVVRVFHGADMFLSTPGAFIHREFRSRRRDGSYCHFEGSLSNLLDEPGVYGIVLNARDSTERMRLEEHFKKSIVEKETMLKEIHHRVKNNLQLISSMLGLQAHQIQDEQIAKIFRESKNRVKSMALIHEKLYQSEDFTEVNFTDYVMTLVRHLFSSYGVQYDTVRFVPELEGVAVSMDMMIHLGLLINELVSNALKYAFPNGGSGEIRVTIAHADDGRMLVMRVCDTGIGFPDDLDFRNTPTLGMQLVNLLAAQLNGTIERERGAGTAFVITFPATRH